MTTPNALAGVGDMIAADLAEPSAPLQSETVSSESSAPSDATATQSQMDESADVSSLEGADSGLPATQDEEDEFQIDLESDPSAADAEAQAQETPQVDPVADPDAEVGKYLATPRGKRIYAEFKKAQILAKPEEEGGIGHNPSAEQIGEYFRAFAETRASQADLLSGTPEGVERWAAKHFGEGAQVPQGTVAQFINSLSRVNRQAYVEAANPILNDFGVTQVQRLMDRWSSTQDAGEKEKLYYAAQTLHADLFGRYFDPSIFAQQQTVNPEMERLNRMREDIQRQQQQLNQQQGSQRQAQSQAFASDIDAQLDRALAFDVDQALAKVKKSVPDVVYRGIRTDYINTVKAEIAKNRQANELLDLAKREAVRGLDKASIPKLVKQYRQMTVNPIMARRSEYITAAGQSFKSQSDAKHAQLQQSASKVAPTNTGAPVPQDLRAAIAPKGKNETHSEYMARLIAADL